LEDYLKSRTPSLEELMKYFKQLIAAMKFLSDKNILHRDIKPSNIVLKDGVIKISDFGCSTITTLYR
jgi:serine/threonine protein kinase